METFLSEKNGSYRGRKGPRRGVRKGIKLPGQLNYLSRIENTQTFKFSHYEVMENSCLIQKCS